MSLDHPYDDTNVFAKIIRGELPSAKIAEDDETLALMDAFPQSEGHCLVIPKTVKATNLLDTPPEVLHRLITKTQLVAAALVDTLQPDGVRIIQFNGAAAGQSVFHVHFHVIPVYVGRNERAHGSSPVPIEELEKIAERLRDRLEG